MPYSYRPRDSTTAHDRSVTLRIEAALWGARFLMPLILSGALLVLIDGISMILRAAVFSAGLSLSLIIGRIGGKRLITTLGTVFDLLLAIREGDYTMRGQVRPGLDPLQGLIADLNLLTGDLRNGRRKRTETSRFLGKTLVRCTARSSLSTTKAC